jgi:hypothetical protein
MNMKLPDTRSVFCERMSALSSGEAPIRESQEAFISHPQGNLAEILAKNQQRASAL